MNIEKDLEETMSSLNKMDGYFKNGQKIIKDNMELGVITFGIVDSDVENFDRAKMIIALVGYLDGRIRNLENNVNNLANLIADKV